MTTSGGSNESGAGNEDRRPERRAEPRRPCRVPVRFRRLATPGCWEADDPFFLTGTVVNISPSGLCLETDLHIAPGQRLELEVNDPDGSGRFAGELVAVRIARVTGEGVVFEFQIGLVGSPKAFEHIFLKTA